MLAEDGFFHSVIGIVSSASPSTITCLCLISFDGADGEGDPAADIGKGSAAVSGLNLVEALNYCSDLLVKFSGHELAAGLHRTPSCPVRRRINSMRASTCPTRTCYHRRRRLRAAAGDNLAPGTGAVSLEPYGIANPVQCSFCATRMLESAPSAPAGRQALLLKGMPGEPPITRYISASPAALDFYPGDTATLYSISA